MSSINLDAGGCGIIISNSAPILDDCHIGDSIAVNGACLTVTEFDKVQDGGWFKVWLANETLERTDLGEFDSETHFHLLVMHMLYGTKLGYQGSVKLEIN